MASNSTQGIALTVFMTLLLSSSAYAGRVLRPHARGLSQQSQPVANRTAGGQLARSFNIITVPTLFTSFLTDGAFSIFPDDGTLDACTVEQPGADGFNNYQYFTSTESAANSIALAFSLDASMWGDSLTSSSSMKSITQTTQETFTMVSDRWLASNSYAVSSSCLRSSALNPELIADWEGLRNNFIFDDMFKSSGAPLWARQQAPCMFPQGEFQQYYVPECQLAFNFFQKWGTHVVTGLMTGSRALYWASALSTSSYSEQDFQASVSFSTTPIIICL